MSRYYCPTCDTAFKRKIAPVKCPICSADYFIRHDIGSMYCRVIHSGKNVSDEFAKKYEFKVTSMIAIALPYRYLERSAELGRLVQCVKKVTGQ